MVVTDYVMPLFCGVLHDAECTVIIQSVTLHFRMLSSCIVGRRGMKQSGSEVEYRKMKKVIGKNVKKYRRMNQWSQESLAEKMMEHGLDNVSINTISCIENGRSLPGLIT